MAGDRQPARALARLLAGLGDDDWARPSLCSGCTVRDVAGHLIVQTRPAELLRLARHAIAGIDATDIRWHVGEGPLLEARSPISC